MIDVQFKFDKTDLEYLKSMPKRWSRGLIKGLKRAALYAEGESKKGFDSCGSGPPNPPPGPLKVRTGHLRRSIRSGVEIRSLIAWIGTDVIYGKVHEETGVGKAKLLRPFLRPAIEDNRDKIANLIRDSILKEYP